MTARSSTGPSLCSGEDSWVFIASIGAITGLMRAPIGEIVSVPGGEAFARAVVAEADGVAAAAGYPLTSASRPKHDGGSVGAPGMQRSIIFAVPAGRRRRRRSRGLDFGTKYVVTMRRQDASGGKTIGRSAP